MSATRKQHKITAELIKRAVCNLDELGVDYAIVIKDLDAVISNVDIRYAISLMQTTIDWQTKLSDKILDAKAEAIADRGEWGGDKEK